MAEFVQTMKDWRRMCRAVPGKSEGKSICSDKESGYVCPLSYSGLCCKAIESQTDEDVISGENIIMSWSAEHPIVYPTWVEWLRQIGVVPRDQKCFHDWLLKPIPAEMAQNLGIEPKESV